MDKCQRCAKRVYPTETMGPVREAVFHKQCFKCVVCSQYLTMKTFNTNEQEAGDREIYCVTHKPKTQGNEYGINSVSIRRAMHVQGHLKVTKLFFAKHHYLTFVGQVKSKIFEAQQQLERQQRREEDELMKEFWVNNSVDLKSMAKRLTAAMVNKHSEEMMNLLSQLQVEITKMIEEEIDAADIDSVMAEVKMVPKEVPKFHPPNCRKRDLYQHPKVFKELDDYVFAIAAKEQTTFTDLVAELTQNCASDLEKARAIFRWITMKDLNVLEFKEGLGKDTPMGLLRGIKYGTESYHTLFMRLCSYAGLPCVSIEGHSKGVGYEPGMKISVGAFRNTWNAVLIAGNWWPVACQWGARYVSTREKAQKKMTGLQTEMREFLQYEYNEYYFLPDPDEFIFQYRAKDDDKQLLKTPVTLDQFEDMPPVKSIFFTHGLQFDGPLKAVLHTDANGITEVKIRLSFAKNIKLSCTLRHAESMRRDETEFRGAKLERFVFHSIVDDLALFSVQVPKPGSYLLELFVSRFDAGTLNGACVFKIVCEASGIAACPLPNCAGAEWGPRRGEHRFGFKALTHVNGVVNVDKDLEMKFTLPTKLGFLYELHKNGVVDSVLEKYVNFIVTDVSLTIEVTLPPAGQYGLAIYTQKEDAADKKKFAYACKYLLNVTSPSGRNTFVGPWLR